MTFRFVALVTPQASDPQIGALAAKTNQLLDGWGQDMATALVTLWSRKTGPGQWTTRRLGDHARLVGLDFNTQVRDPNKTLTGTWGAYVLISADLTRQEVSVLRDPTGRLECWRIQLGGAALLFSHFEDIAPLLPAPPRVDWDYLTHHLNHDWLYGEATAVAGVSEVLPGQCVTFSTQGVRSRMAWQAEEVAQTSSAGNPHEAQAELRRQATLAVGQWTRTYDRIVLDLSGGLDSAIVLGLIRQAGSSTQVVGFNKVTPGAAGDERRYARLAADRHDIPLIEREPPILELGPIMRDPLRLMRPRTRLLPLGYDEIGVDVSKTFGADAFFTGTGGDHLFYDHLGGVALCDHLQRTRSLAGAPEMAVRLAQLSGDTVWGVAGAAARHYLGPRLGPHVIAPVGNRFLSPLAQVGFKPDAYTHPTASAALGKVPPAKIRQILYLLELQRHYQRYGRADTADEIHPLFAQPLMESCLRIPAPWFGFGGVQRGLARQAFADLLPEDIRTRRSKGGSTAHLVRFMQTNLPRIRDMLLDGRLADHGLLDRRRLEGALHPLPVAAAKDFSSINICLAAELWVRQVEGTATIA